MHGSINKTLIIRFSSVGDIVLSTLLVRVMRKRFPGSRMDFMVKSEHAALLRHHPGISGLLELPAHGTLGDLLRLRRRIREERYDLILDIHDSIRSRLVSWGAGRVVRIKKRRIPRFLLVKFKWNVYRWFGGAPSVAERYIEPVRFLGVADDGEGLDIFLPPEASGQADRLLTEAGIQRGGAVIACCPSARHTNKRWLKERFAAAAAVLATDYHAAIVLLGTAEEQERCVEIADMIRVTRPDVITAVLAGRTSLTDAAAVLDRCMLVITNDTGLMHVAAARKRKIVALFGPTVREFGFFPFGTASIVEERAGLYCRPCTSIGRDDCPEGHFRCMTEIPAEQVIAAAHSLLTP